MPSYEKIKDLKISLITKYSEYKPNSKRVNIYEIHKFNNYIIDTLYFLIKSFFQIIEINKKEPIDILNIHNFFNLIISPLLVRLFFKIPILMKIPIDFSTHLIDSAMQEKHKIRTKIINYSWFKFFKYYILKKINFIRSINTRIYKDLIDLKIQKKIILQVPNGISCNRLIGLSKNEHNGINFGYVGRIVKLKNILFLLEVFKLYISKNPYDKLFLYGEGPYEKFILKFISKNKLTNKIILCGFEKDKRKIYSNIDVLIDPAFSQGISNANLEAMCSNTFLIASNVYGNRELVKHKVTGLLFNPYKKEDLFNQLLFYKEKKNIIKQIISNANNEILLNYDINVIANKIYKWLKLIKNF